MSRAYSHASAPTWKAQGTGYQQRTPSPTTDPTPFIADGSDTARQLDHITVQVVEDKARYAFNASQGSLQDDRTLGLTRVPMRCHQATVALVGTLVHHCSAYVRAEVTRMLWEIAGAHSICPEVHYPVPEFATLAEGDWVHRVPGPWPVWGWGSTTPSGAPGQPMSSYSPRRAMLSCCASPSCGTTTRAA